MLQPHISIIVPTRNRSALLARLLTSLTQLRYPHWCLIVVDDGSTDDTPAVVERYRLEGLPVRYVYQPWSKMGAARNRGLELAAGEIVAFTDDDCLVDPDWLNAIARTFAFNPEALGVQGKTLTDHAAMTPFTRQIEQLEGGPPYRTCNIAYRTAVLRELGGFDPQLIRGEDVVMAMRVLERGSIEFAPEAVVIHPPRPKEWAGRQAWRVLLESELHFRRTYPQYAWARSPTLSVQKAEHVVSRWLVLPVVRYWRWHYAYLRRNPGDYLRHVPLIVREKLALLSLMPFFWRQWLSPHPQPTLTPGPSPTRGRGESGEQVALDNSPSPASPCSPVPPWPGGEGRTTVSVVVPTRNRAALLPDLLAALDAQDYPSYEVIVVDDASEDETPSILSRWAGGKRVALRLDTPSGSYAARNRGWRAARGDLMAFTDDDCLPRTGWLSALVRAVQESEAVGVQGVTCVSPGEITPFTHQIEQRHPGPPYRTCNIAYPRRVLERLGGFDDSMRWYADNILGLRARELGPIVFAPEAVVHHPPRPRQWRDRTTWLARFQADLAHRRVLHELGVEPVAVPSRALPVILWVLRPLVKQSGAHARYGVRHPIGYLRELRPMMWEKWELLCALREFWAGARMAQAAIPLPPLAPQPLVSVVVVTSERAAMLEDALASLKAQTWTRRQIIVVDHAGCARTRDLAREWGADYVAAGGLTLAAARQEGVAVARGEIVAFTDDDCLADRRWLEALVHGFQGRPQLHGVQGRTLGESGWVGAHVVRVSRSDPLYQTCNMAYRRAALELAGGLDLRFQGWFEDTALAARVLRHGPIGFEPRALVTHRAVPRRPLDRVRWKTLLEDERLLARDYSSFYRRTRGPGFTATVIGRWLLGSPLKTLLRELFRAPAQPRAYLRLARLLFDERIELLRALRMEYGKQIHGG